jgi:hypothetical protein
MVKTRFVEIDHILLCVHLCLFRRSMMHLGRLLIEGPRDPRGVFPRLHRISGRGPTEHLTDLHFDED